MLQHILVSSLDHGVRTVSINRPERRNALDIATIVSLGAYFAEAEVDDSVRSVVITGNEKAFSAGADISEMSRFGFAALERPERCAGWNAIERFTKPIIAAAEGMALGGGLELLLLADIAIAGRSTKLGLPETRIGLIPGDGGTQRLTRLIGRARATRMIFTGEPVTADEAQHIGLISEAVLDGTALERAIQIATIVAGGALSALRMAKSAILASAETPLTMGLGVERHAAARAFESEEGFEGIKAFLEKRPPRFVS
jgi:enoyl-CoA hydratase